MRLNEVFDGKIGVSSCLEVGDDRALHDQLHLLCWDFNLPNCKRFLDGNPLASGLGITAKMLAILFDVQTVRLAWRVRETAVA